MSHLPFDDYKVVYRLRAGLQLAKWNNIVVMHAAERASGFLQQDLAENLGFEWRPYRKSVQYCKTCGNTGHRQNVCPRPLPAFCSKCGKTNQLPGHVSKLRVSYLRGQEHETTRKHCKKILKPNPPPFHIRQQCMDRLKARDIRWSLADEEFPELGSQTTNLRSSAGSART
ncbi:hypothetical protein HPB50_027130 [Hyalomma asiaticum]|uniref:Uncharacterized protein n=1 Tax=Hyalomma asiaticum TaxID=266040 RepID=A0ACB7RQZ5_HYAAI|nr:hypothetical protein HPB50_027130 [Hyalomma asiaticum]